MVAVLLYVLTLIAIVVGGSLRFWFRVREARTRVMLRTLAALTGRNLPLVPALEAAARHESRGVARRYLRLAERLNVGEDVAAALHSATGWYPGQVSGALLAGERSGTLPSVLAAVAGSDRFSPQRSGSIGSIVWYPVLLLLALPTVAFAFLVFVAPVYNEIIADYGGHAPGITLWVLAVTDKIAGAHPFVLPALVAAVLLLIHGLILRHFLHRSPVRFQFFFAAWDTLVWYLPLARTVARNRALARQLPILLTAVRAGNPLHEAARHAALVGANYHAVRNLRRFADRMERGAPPEQAARRAGLPRAVVRALRGAASPDELAARLEYLADYYHSLLVHWERLILSASVPVMVVMWGLIVGSIVLAFILPIVVVIEAAVASVY